MAAETPEAAHDIHLIVLVHGLWGNPGHLNNLANTLRKAWAEEELHILIVKRNSGTLTYDGIETGGERVAHEITEEIEQLGKIGKRVTRFSVVGYSLGGLLARYAIGLLDNKGFFNKVDPVNFTTFATPHLGTRTPLLGWHNQLFNDLGARTLSNSGYQLWMIDQFRDTKRPLLAILADPESIFIPALKRFKNISLYSNIVNDRSVPFYTSCIETHDPFIDLDTVDINYVPDTEEVIVQHPLGDKGFRKEPATPKSNPMTFYESLSSAASRIWSKAPLYFFMVTLAPIVMTGFLASSGYQSFRSAARIKEHEEGRSGVDYSQYHFPLLSENMKQKALEAFTQMTHSQHQEMLEDSLDEIDSSKAVSLPPARRTISAASSSQGNGESSVAPAKGNTASDADTPPESQNEEPFPTLALTDEQFGIVKSLNDVGFRKYPVHIKKANHSHAAIVVRMNRPGFGEGKIVAKHWVERFEI